MDTHPEVDTPRIRTAVLLGAAGAGKTTLAEAILAAGGERARGGILDRDPEEVDRGHTLSLGVGSVLWRDHRLNLLDTPGDPDAVGDAYPALHAADVAVLVVDAVAGWQAVHDEFWGACADLALPRIVVLNGLDRDRAAYQRHVDVLRERYGKPVAPVHMPIGVERDFDGVIDLLHGVAVRRVYDDPDRRSITVDIPEERRDQAARNREALVEAIVEVDDDLLARYLDGEVPPADDLAGCFADGIAREGFFPLLCASAALDVGARLLADFLVDECPSPAARREVDGPPSALVVKTRSDPFVGHVSVLHVRSGRLVGDEVVTDLRTGRTVRLHRLFALQGDQQVPVTSAAAGDVVAAAKLDDVRTGDVLAADGAPDVSVDVVVPVGFHRVAIATRSARDEDRLPGALQRLTEEDPSLRVETDGVTGQLVLVTYGPGHVQTAIDRLERRFGVAVDEVPLRLHYLETVTTAASGLGRHVKQTGGSGQYGIAQIEIAPLARGEGFRFVDETVGGVIPRQYIGSVEKGVRTAMERGIVAGYPCVDVAVRLVDGRSHRVDSSQVAFEMAGALAFRDAATQAGPVLLEPIAHVEVTVPDAHTGDVMGDLASRRSRIEGTRPARPGWTVVVASVPEAELLGYVGDLRGLTQGQGTVTVTHDHHAPVPDHVRPHGVEPAAGQDG